MTRVMVTAGLALAVSAGAALAADFGKGRERASRELRVHRAHDLSCESFYARLPSRFFNETSPAERCRLVRAYRPGIWRGYPQGG